MYAGVWYYNKHYSCAPEAGSATVKYSRVTKSSRRLRSKDHWIAVPLGEEFKIVTRQQWQRVQQKITANISWSPRNSKHNYLLRGLVRCAGCNARMVGEPGRNSFSYRCHKRCKKVPEIVEGRLNSTVWGAVERALKNPKAILVQGRRYYEERKQISTAMKRTWPKDP
jgi:site-specific DNA recombinase